MHGIMLIVLLLSLSGCTALQSLTTPGSSVVLTLQDSALVVGELALAVDRAEREAYAANLYPQARHQQVGTIVLRLLQAAQTFERAIANNQPSGEAKLAVNRALDDLLTATPDIPVITRAAGALGTIVGDR